MNDPATAAQLVEWELALDTQGSDDFIKRAGDAIRQIRRDEDAQIAWASQDKDAMKDIQFAIGAYHQSLTTGAWHVDHQYSTGARVFAEPEIGNRPSKLYKPVNDGRF